MIKGNDNELFLHEIAELTLSDFEDKASAYFETEEGDYITLTRKGDLFEVEYLESIYNKFWSHDLLSLKAYCDIRKQLAKQCLNFVKVKVEEEDEHYHSTFYFKTSCKQVSMITKEIEGIMRILDNKIGVVTSSLLKELKTILNALNE